MITGNQKVLSSRRPVRGMIYNSLSGVMTYKKKKKSAYFTQALRWKVRRGSDTLDLSLLFLILLPTSEQEQTILVHFYPFPHFCFQKTVLCKYRVCSIRCEVGPYIFLSVFHLIHQLHTLSSRFNLHIKEGKVK